MQKQPLTVRQIKNLAKKGNPIPWEVTNNLPYKDTNIQDYHFSVQKDATPLTRLKHNIGNIYVNALKCLKCNTTVRSRNRHHMITCSCGSCSIDGGSWYVKVTGNQEDYQLITIPFDKVYKDELTDNKEPKT